VKTGDNVRDIKTRRLGVSQGPTTMYGVEWILVFWEDGGRAIVLEKCLEVTSEGV